MFKEVNYNDLPQSTKGKAAAAFDNSPYVQSAVAQMLALRPGKGFTIDVPAPIHAGGVANVSPALRSYLTHQAKIAGMTDVEFREIRGKHITIGRKPAAATATAA